MIAFNAARDQRIYANVGNYPLVELLEGDVLRVLDVGCGAGDNAALIRARYPDAQISGVTVSPAEAEVAKAVLDTCWIFDIEGGELPPVLQSTRFDTLVFSHVLEHLRDPAVVLARFVTLLQPGGQVLIAVPNVLGWRQRLQFLYGRFEYESAGVLDDTHLRFFTYFTADRYLLNNCTELHVVHKSVTGSVPLWWLRRYVLPASWSAKIDQFGCKRWPNLFGGQVLIKAIKS